MKKAFSSSINEKKGDITPESLYINRRQFIKSLGLIGFGALLASCGTPPGFISSGNPTAQNNGRNNSLVDELGDPANRYEDITNYNNYFEFTSVKQDVAHLSKNFNPAKESGGTDFTLEVYGLVNHPKVFSLDDLLTRFQQEERIYRLRCVEAWSMVIPWTGFSLAALLKEVDPISKAKFVRFETIYAPSQMPGLKNRSFPWPYQEGLRLDEAMHQLTILATGLYGNPLPPQNGMPIRLVVPWKYGYKSIKAITKIELVAQQTETFWTKVAPREYSFDANVNPYVDHPRWSQKTERRIGESQRRPTLLFNGYAEEVVSMYKGMEVFMKIPAASSNKPNESPRLNYKEGK